MTIRFRLPVLQAAYYAASGAAPIAAYRLFERLSGPKREPWLVKTMGLVTLAIASVLARAPRDPDPQTRLLGLSAALAYGVADVWYAGVRRRISPVYLLDALVEATFVAAWMAQRREARPR